MLEMSLNGGFAYFMVCIMVSLDRRRGKSEIQPYGIVVLVDEAGAARGRSG